MASIPDKSGKPKTFQTSIPSRFMQRFVFTAQDGKKVLFREPKKTDARLLMEFINAFVDEPRSGLLINRKGTLKEEQAWLKQTLESIKNRKTVMLTVEFEGKLVGNCDLRRLTWKSSHVADLGIAISKEMRGKGIGEALVKKTIELAKKRMRGLELVTLKTFEYNKSAQGLYKKVGFFEVGRIPMGNKEGDEYFDDLIMVLRL
jgi:RimJ/RimL family protein N-acetyltransferase